MIPACPSYCTALHHRLSQNDYRNPKLADLLGPFAAMIMEVTQRQVNTLDVLGLVRSDLASVLEKIERQLPLRFP